MISIVIDEEKEVSVRIKSRFSSDVDQTIVAIEKREQMNSPFEFGMRSNVDVH